MIASRKKHSILSTLQAGLTKNLNPLVDAIIDKINNPHTSNRLSQYVYLFSQGVIAINSLKIQHKMHLEAKNDAQEKMHVQQVTDDISALLALIDQPIQQFYPDPKHGLIAFFNNIKELSRNNNVHEIMNYYEITIYPIIANKRNLEYSKAKNGLHESDETLLLDYVNKHYLFTQMIKPHLAHLHWLLTERIAWTATSEQKNNILPNIAALESFISDLKKSHFRNALLEAWRWSTPWDVIDNFLYNIKLIDVKLGDELVQFIAPLYDIPIYAESGSLSAEEEKIPKTEKNELRIARDNSASSNEDRLEKVELNTSAPQNSSKEAGDENTEEKSSSTTSSTSTTEPCGTSIIMQKLSISTISASITTQKTPIYLDEQLRNNCSDSPALQMFESEGNYLPGTQNNIMQTSTLPSLALK